MAQVINVLGDGKPKFNKRVAEAMGFTNFPQGNYELSTTSSSEDDIPWVANFVSDESNTGSGQSKTPSWSINGRVFMSAYVRKTNGTGTSSQVKITWQNPKAYGIFLPQLYGNNVGALMNARASIISKS